MAPGGKLCVGARVSVKQSVSRPAYGWGSVKHGMVGVVTRIDSDGDLKVDFAGTTTGWNCKSSEMEVMHSKADAKDPQETPKVPAKPKEGDRVRALPGIESQGVDIDVVGMEGTVVCVSDDLQVNFGGRTWYTSADYVENIEQTLAPEANGKQNAAGHAADGRLEGLVLNVSDAAAVHVQLGGRTGPVYLLDSKDLFVRPGVTKLEIELHAAADGSYGIQGKAVDAMIGGGGLCVSSLKAGSPAAKDGRLATGDIIRIVDGQLTLDGKEVLGALKPPGSTSKASSDWPEKLFKAFHGSDGAQLQLALDASGGQAATHSIYAQASDKPPDLDDSGGYYRLEGTGSGSWYKSQGITAGMSVLEIAEALAAKVPSSAPMPGVVKTWLAKHLSGARSKVTLVAFRKASAHGATSTAMGDDNTLMPTRAPSKYDPEQLLMRVVDVLGPPPEVEHVPDLKAALAELDRQVGLEAVKEQARTLIKLAQINYQRELNCEPPHLVPLNRLFLGNPGTGKTTIAKVYGRILKGLGYLSDGSVEVRTPSDLIASAAGGTEEKTAALLEICKGKVLVIDEAYGLHEGLYGARAIDTIVSKVHNSPGEDIAVLLLGYEDEMMKMLREVNPGLMRRFSPESAFHFADFTDSQLEELLHLAATAAGLRWAKRSVCKAALNLLIRERIKPHFGNAGAVNSLMGRVKESLAGRGDARSITLADLGLHEGASGGTAKTASLLHEVEEEMATLFKADGLRAHFDALAARLAQLQTDGELDPSMPADKVGNYVFVGNPGTGKTTFARVLGKWLRAKGVLVGDGFAEQSALNLQGEYLGHTKTKVDELMASAPGGLVFIDEAYNLGGGGMRGGLYAKEAVDQLTFNLSAPQYKGKSIVVLAGYEKEMDAMLAGANPGFRSRFKQRITLPDWDADDVVAYLLERCNRKGFAFSKDAQAVLRERLARIQKRPGWANARDAEWVYDELAGMRAQRLAAAAVRGVDEGQPSFTVEDARSAMDSFDRHRPSPPHLEKAFSMGSSMSTTINSGAEDYDDLLPPMREGGPPARELEEEREEIRIIEIEAKDSCGDCSPDVAAALQEACVELGYDESDAKRRELVTKLSGCEGSKDFPPDILGLVCSKTGRDARDIIDELRAQVGAVLSSMREAIKEAETEQHRIDAAVREKIKEMCLCPAGFDWHREGDGWRCNGGSHFLSNAQLNTN
jgi:SpoVK/Ycf46/Vps4 family AAA+-type ATPase